ncbi:biotin carboxylase N-terminal domain-containing protein [Ottowia thiooxydans]|uniref:ATP-binding protein n=1 Tax=Ottowia thiooxydans TaxID=219182 RepID=UPI000411F3D3|nr:biotin carboxylase N-terminal domain-containing protein [Ottowia thiooxydans]
MFKKILIANRGEIACRIARTVRRMGLRVATVHSSADTEGLHVREIGESVWVGEGPARQSYLDIEAVLAAAQRVGADAVHPGYGFLSENPQFGRRCADLGIAFIGPSPEVLALFGDKTAAKKLAVQLGITTAGGLDEPSDDVEALLAAVSLLPTPYILKAVAGGGGKGMRVVRDALQAREAITAAIREGRSSFGDGRLLAERYLSKPRHIEVQILGDGSGKVLHLYDRECSLQRRYQKVVEEAPVTNLPQSLRKQLWAHAVALGKAVNYRGLGTVEFAVTGESAVFLEVNPRLQVEHPVTEAVTGLDLVELQIRTVAEGRLPFSQEELADPRGVSAQARLYAEDPAQNFLPSTGCVEVFEMAPGLRTDTGVSSGSVISAHYDPMIAKLIAHADTRKGALAQLREGLAETTVLGVTSNRGFLLDLLADADVQANGVTTEFIDGWLSRRGTQPEPTAHVAALLALWLAQQRASTGSTAGAWYDAALTGWRIARGGVESEAAATYKALSSSGDWKIGFAPSPAPGEFVVDVNGTRHRVAAHEALSGWQPVTVDGLTLRLRAHCFVERASALIGEAQIVLDIRPAHDARAGASAAHSGLVRAPMMGLVVGVHVASGQLVTAGQRLATIESMKMEMAITSPMAGTLSWVGCATQARVERHQDLFRIDPAA